MKVLVTQLCPALCDPVDRSLPGSSAHGIFQASLLDWVVISFSRGSSRPRDQTWVSRIASRFFTVWDTGEALYTIEYANRFSSSQLSLRSWTHPLSCVCVSFDGSLNSGEQHFYVESLLWQVQERCVWGFHWLCAISIGLDAMLSLLCKNI